MHVVCIEYHVLVLTLSSTALQIRSSLSRTGREGWIDCAMIGTTSSSSRCWYIYSSMVMAAGS
jgi:hypothetical protein